MLRPDSSARLCRPPDTLADFDGRVAREVIVSEPPLWASWFALFVVCAICLALLSRKVKAYEVVR